MSDLSVEKLNADRITKLEEKVDRKLDHLEDKLNQVLTFVAKEKNGGGQHHNWKNMLFSGALNGLLVTLLLILIAGNSQRLDKHIAIEGHPPTLKVVSSHQSDIASVKSRITGHDTRFDALRKDTDNISALRVNVAKLAESQNNIERGYEKVEGMAESFHEKGMLTEKIQWLEQKIIDMEKGLTHG